MSLLKKLAGQTAIYGLSSIIGRSLNFLLVPLYTGVFTEEAYGVVTEFYAYIAFFTVILTYGMETAMFRFINKHPDRERVYGSALTSVVSSSVAFMVVFLAISQPLAMAMGYPTHPEYIIWVTLILGFDAISAVPFAKLRADEKATRFATVKLINIGLNISINLFFLLLCRDAGGFLGSLYNESIGIGYIFIANLVASTATVVLLLPELKGLSFGFDRALWAKMLQYGLPLLFVGLAGIINETFDRAILKYMVTSENQENLRQLGVYGANYKLAMFMTIFIQAFRYAAEPFFFSHAQKTDSRKIYSDVMTYFVIFGCLIFLMVTLYLDIFKHFLRNPGYWEGLNVVPILLLANLLLGIYVNLSIWYKLSDMTRMGAAVSVLGAFLTILLNLVLIPVFGGYEGCAWATLIVYLVMCTVSWRLGKRYYHINYNVRKIAFYIGVALVVYLIGFVLVRQVGISGMAARMAISSVFFLLYLGMVYVMEGAKLRKLV